MDDRTAAVSTKAPRTRRLAAALAGAALAAGLLTACGGSGPSAASSGAPSGTAASPSASGSPSAPASSAPSTPSASPTPQPSGSPAQPTSPGIAVGEPTPTPVKIPATGYRLESPTRLTVFFFAGVCDKYGLKVEEDTPPVLKVRVVITETAPRGQACPQIIKGQQVTATLSKPVTSGGVVDLATGEQLPPATDAVGGPR
ncbi:hypothetical protein AB0K51_02565 [Kitasatospora sp. NPDC049285]|uniref:hypothetical protein n=1 Tax=Kitasatospora sp. NPDC049285 TaxID=3157096 RepID=UPI0034496CB5